MPKSKSFDWSPELAALTSDEFPLSVPFSTFTGEAHDVARYFRKYYKADKATGRPGLVDAGKKVSPALGDEIDALIVDAKQAQVAYRMTVDPRGDRGKLDRAIEIVSEMSAVLKFHFDDGVDDEDDVRIANLVKAHEGGPETPDALAQALEEWAALADMHKTEIEGLGGFDPAMIREAKKLATELLDVPETARPSAETQRALGKRNQLLQLLDQRVRMVRTAAKFVFRAVPDLARESSSAYERVRRVKAKRTATRAKNDTNGKQPTEPVTPSA